MSRFEPATKAWARRKVLDIVAGAYAGWVERCRWDRRAREPSLTVAALTDDLDQHATPIDYRASPRRWRVSLVRSICESLERAGELQSSIGIGDSGREARCFEPPKKG